MIEYDVTIECGGVTVQPGDLIFGDMDGVVVIPKAIEKLVIEQALDKVSGENLVRNKIREGMKVSEVFQTYGIL